MATSYDDFFRLLQSSQPQRLDNPYSGVSLALSNAVQGFLMGKDRKQKRDASEAVATALMGAGGGANIGSLMSGQVGGIAAGGGLPDYEGVKKSLAALGDNPYAQEMLLNLGLGDLKETAKTRNKLVELGYAGEVEKDVYRDRRQADVGYIGQEYGLKSQLSNQEYKQRIDEAERQTGLDLTKLREQKTLENQNTLNQIEAQLGADLTRSEASVWEYGAKQGIQTEQEGVRGEAGLERDLRKMGAQAGTNLWEHTNKGRFDTEQLGIRGESELDRQRRLYGYQADEALRQASGEAGINVWEHGAKEGITTQQEGIRGESALQRALREAREKGEIDVDTYDRTQAILTEQEGLRGEAGLDRRRREFGYQTDEALREKRGSVDEDIRKKRGEVAAEAASAATGFFTSKSIDADIARNIVSIGPRIMRGEAVTPEEQAAFNYSIGKATEPKTVEANGQIITIPGMTQDQIFQGLGMAAQATAPVAVGTDRRVSYAEAQRGEPVSGTAPPFSRAALHRALIRQESGGNPRARSEVGARGLMQLMPETAVEVAREMGIRNFKVDWLDNPEINQKLGTYYLDKQLDANNGNVPMALAAYNAGPHRVEAWRRKYGDPLKGEISVREWVNRIPFKETKGYVKNIMGMLARSAPPGGVAPMPAPQPPLPSRQPSLPANIAVPQRPGALVPPAPPPQQPGLPPGAQAYTVPPSEAQRLQMEKDRVDIETKRAEGEKKVEEASSAQAKKKELLQASLRRLNSATRILEDPDNWATGPAGRIASYVPGTSANDLYYELNTLKNQFTGGNLEMMSGVLSDTDLAILGGLAGSLEPGMPKAQLQKTLADMRAIMTADMPDDDVSKMSDDELKKALGL